VLLPQGQGAPTYLKEKEKKKKNDAPTCYLLPFLEFFLRFSGLFLENTSMAFLGSSCRETAKNAIKTIEGEIRQEGSFFFSSQLFPKVFDMDFPQKLFDGVFELPLLRNALKTP
jgi:hypothetical protein